MKKLVVLLFMALPIYAMEEGDQNIQPQLRFENVYKEAKTIFNELTPKQRDKFLESGDCITMLGKIISAIGEKNHEEAMKYYKRFTSRTEIDYHWMNENQEKTYNQLIAELDSMVIKIPPVPILILRTSEQQAIGHLETEEWLIKIIENNMCEGLEWCSLFGKPDSTTKYLTPEYLKNERLKKINYFSQLKKTLGSLGSEQLD
jgi:hypothetical protein